MKVYVVIVAYNPAQWVDKCFSSLYSSSITLKVIVVDNGSTDNSSTIIKRKFPKVEFIHSRKNLGFGAANNVGIKKAYEEGADFVFLLNQDAWVDSDTIEKLVNISSNNAEYGILSPIHYNGSGTNLDYNFSTFLGSDRCKGLVSDLVTGRSLKNVYPIKFVNAAAWLITRSCIEVVGGFNPSFFHYAEDLNYTERVYFHNLKVGVVPDVKIYHDREGRKESSFLKDPETIFRRNVIKALSRPGKRKSKAYFYVLAMKMILNFFFKKDSLGLNDAVNNLKVLHKVSYSEIDNNRQKSMKKGKTFLS